MDLTILVRYSAIYFLLFLLFILVVKEDRKVLYLDEYFYVYPFNDRLMAGQTAEYSRKGVSILRYFTPRPNLRDLFKVELHMRLLFGHRGAQAKHLERKAKFQQILSILSERAESHDLGTEF